MTHHGVDLSDRRKNSILCNRWVCRQHGGVCPAPTIMEAKGLVEGYSFWTFSDIFEENYFPSIAFHGGFGLLNLHGIPKPTYRAFQLLHDVGTEQLLVDGLHETVDASVIRKNSTLTILLTNHATPGHSIEAERVKVRLESVAEPRKDLCPAN